MSVQIRKIYDTVNSSKNVTHFISQNESSFWYCSSSVFAFSWNKFFSSFVNLFHLQAAVCMNSWKKNRNEHGYMGCNKLFECFGLFIYMNIKY